MVHRRPQGHSMQIKFTANNSYKSRDNSLPGSLPPINSPKTIHRIKNKRSTVLGHLPGAFSLLKKYFPEKFICGKMSSKRMLYGQMYRRSNKSVKKFNLNNVF
jgi:hypothetical protein